MCLFLHGSVMIVGKTCVYFTWPHIFEAFLEILVYFCSQAAYKQSKVIVRSLKILWETRDGILVKLTHTIINFTVSI